MAKYHYKAVDKQGVDVSGEVEADNAQQASLKVRDLGYFVTKVALPEENFGQKVQKVSENLSQNFSIFESKKVPPRALAAFTRQLATLITSGLPLLRSLEVLREQQKPGPLKNVAAGLYSDVEAGGSFSEALSRYPQNFSRLFMSMVRAGEAGGVLDVVLARLADFAESSQMFRSKIKSASIYPAIVVLMASLVVGILIVFVIPKFEDIFSELGSELPMATQLLLGTSQFLQHYWWVLAAVFLVVLVAYRLLIVKKPVRQFVDRIQLKTFVIGELIQKINVARFCRTLGTLLASGVPILQALDIVRETCTNVVFEEAVSTVQDSVREGGGIATRLKAHNIFPPVMVNMVDVGEESGALDAMLIKTADIYEHDVEVMIESITKMVEPALIVVMAVIVGFIVISLFLPLISMMSSLGA